MPEYSSPVVYRDLHRITTRTWMGHLTPSQMLIVAFVFDRTIGWGKDRERITLDHFMNGVSSHKDELVYAHGCGLCETTVKRTIRQLVGLGVITRENGWYGINFEWSPDMKKLAQPKASKAEQIDPENTPEGGVKNTPRGGKNAPTRGVKMRPLREDKERGDKEEETEPTSVVSGTSPFRKRIQGGSIDENHKLAMERMDSRREEAMGKIRERQRNTHRLSVRDLDTLWTQWVTDYPQVVYPQKDFTILRSYAGRWMKARPGMVFSDYLQWIMQNWTRIRFAEFLWMTSPAAPQTPDPKFIVTHARIFEGSYADRARIEEEANLPERERMIRAEVAKGRPRHVVEGEVDEILDQKRMVAELREEREALAKERRKRQNRDAIRDETTERVRKMERIRATITQSMEGAVELWDGED